MNMKKNPFQLLHIAKELHFVAFSLISILTVLFHTVYVSLTNVFSYKKVNKTVLLLCFVFRFVHKLATFSSRLVSRTYVYEQTENSQFHYHRQHHLTTITLLGIWVSFLIWHLIQNSRTKTNYSRNSNLQTQSSSETAGFQHVGVPVREVDLCYLWHVTLSAQASGMCPY